MWDEGNKAVIKLHQEPDDENVDADSDHNTSTINAFEPLSNKDREDTYSAASATHLSSIDEPGVSESDGLDDMIATFTPWGDREKVDIADLDTHGSYAVVATGGRGGNGSSIFASRHGPLPSPEDLSVYAKPQDGETAFLELELKLIADIGLVGFPNAGKSSLLAAMSRATPHIAPYPFTTLNPLVGYIEYTDGSRLCVADVPGLIHGASEGRGKGHDFLRHLERTKALLFVSCCKTRVKLFVLRILCSISNTVFKIVDAAGMDGRDPLNDLAVLVEELAAYGDGDMLNRRSLVVANKMDLLNANDKMDVMDGLMSVVEEAGIHMEGDIIGISAGVTGEGLSSLSNAMRDIVNLSEVESARQIAVN